MTVRTSRLSRLLRGAVAGALVALVCSQATVVAHAAPVSGSGALARGAGTFTHTAPSVSRQIDLSRRSAPPAMPRASDRRAGTRGAPFPWLPSLAMRPLANCLDCNPSDLGGSGGSGSSSPPSVPPPSSCTTSLQLASAPIARDGWVTLFENTCTGQVWAHTWVGVAVIAYSAALAGPGGSQSSQAVGCLFGNCAINTTAVSHQNGGAYQACGVATSGLTSDSACTPWIQVNS